MDGIILFMVCLLIIFVAKASKRDKVDIESVKSDAYAKGFRDGVASCQQDLGDGL